MITKNTKKKAVLILFALPLFSCSGSSQSYSTRGKEARNLAPLTRTLNVEDTLNSKQKINNFLTEYFDNFQRLEKEQTTSYWNAACSGSDEDFNAYQAAELALRKLHSDPQHFTAITDFLKQDDSLSPFTKRSLTLAELAFKGNQLPHEMLKQMVEKATEIEQLFNTYRGELKGTEHSNNELLDLLRVERNSDKRKAVWQALKQVGQQVAPSLIELARLRNKAASMLGYANFWEMQIHLQEHDPKMLLSIFDELEQLTTEPFKAMKRELDSELARRFGLRPEQLMPWHYDNPFFQEAPPSAKIDLDDFYKDIKQEEVVEIARAFYNDLGLPIDDIIEKSDLYERDGKDQHAFCIAIDRQGDIRTLLNIKPTYKWMETMLHEQGHAVYYKFLNYDLPYNLREAAHIFTTEAIAMMFGALAGNPNWLVERLNVDKARIATAEKAILEQRRREQLIFARWTLVMLYFEKTLYENPEADLNTYWWDYVERFQGLKRPAGRDVADWAAKPHFTIAPVYYHNYMLGELFAAQLRSMLVRETGHHGPTHALSFDKNKTIGEILKSKIFAPGASMPWPKLVESATGEPLTAKYFAAELGASQSID